MEGPVKSLLSVHLSVRLSVCPSIRPSVLQFGISLRNGSLVFSDFLHDGKYLKYLKTDKALFSSKIHFCPNLDKKGPKWP